jgi:beta-lactamase regulating signal transducer with metallopeptidase domain/nitrous oxidase accessory protein NosD
MNTIVENINTAGRAFVGFALPMLIQSSALVVILLAVDFVLRKRVRAVFRYWIWLLVLLKLVLPPSLWSPVSLGTWLGDRLEVPAAVVREPQPPAAESPSIAEDIVASRAPRFMVPPVPHNEYAGAGIPSPAPIEMPFEDVQMGQPATVAESAPPVLALQWQGLVLLVWAAVAAALLLLLLQRGFFVRGLVAQTQDVGAAMQEVLNDCLPRVGVRRHVGLRLSPVASSPAVCGLFHPVILIPQSLASGLDADALRAILLHELAHVKRGDLWVSLAQTLLQIVYFYNPLLWLANAMIRRTREQAVDEAVLVAMGEAAPQYPETLVNIAKLAFRKRPALSPRLIGVVESKSALSARIKHMLTRPLPKTTRLGVVGFLIILIVAAVVLPMAKARPLTDRANRIMILAAEEARALHHDYIGTEHILLALTSDTAAVSAKVVQGLGLDGERVKTEVLKRVQLGSALAPSGELPMMPRAKRVLEYAEQEARSLKHDYIGTEHILLALMHQRDSVAAQVLDGAGVTLPQMRAEVLRFVQPGRGVDVPGTGADNAGGDALIERGTNVGQVMVARWMVVLKGDAATAVLANAEPLASKSKSYQAIGLGRADLLARVRDGMASGQVLWLVKELEWMRPSPKHLRADSWARTTNVQHPVYSQCGTGGAGPYKLDTSGTEAKLDLQHEIANCELNPGVRVEGSIFFKGSLPVDRALVFAAPLRKDGQTVATHLVIWQAVRVSGDAVASVRSINSAARWVEEGPSRLIARAEAQDSRDTDDGDSRWIGLTSEPPSQAVEAKTVDDASARPGQAALQQLIDGADVGGVVMIPKGLYTTPVTITRPMTLRGVSREECVFEVTADQPAVSVNTKGQGEVTVENVTVRWQLATSGKVEQPYALAVRDANVLIRNCRFEPLGNYQRSPVAARIDGFSKATVDNCRFNRFEYTVCYGPGTEGVVQDCTIVDSGHQGVTNYEGAVLTVQRCIVTGSKFHAVRCTGGTLNVRDNLLIHNANRGIYLGNRSGRGSILNNLILGNGTGISGFARATYVIANNVIVDNSYAGIDMRDSCQLNIYNNVLVRNQRGIMLQKEGTRNYNVVSGNTYWANATDVENMDKPQRSITGDPQFADPNHGDFTLRGPARERGHGLTDPQVIEDLWKRYEQAQRQRTDQPVSPDRQSGEVVRELPAGPSASGQSFIAPEAPGPIQQRIDAAAPGATVKLEPGVYKERLTIDKPLTLEGAGGEGLGPVG